jgi:hypothetical protein
MQRPGCCASSFVVHTHLTPSGVWWFSSKQHMVRSVAVSVPFSMCTYSFCASPSGVFGIRSRTSSRLDCNVAQQRTYVRPPARCCHMSLIMLELYISDILQLMCSTNFAADIFQCSFSSWLLALLLAADNCPSMAVYTG